MVQLNAKYTLHACTPNPLLSFREKSDFIFNRLKLDRRRLEAGHMRYALLRVCQRYVNVFSSSLSISHDVNTTIKDVTPHYFIEFTKKYAGT